MNLTDLLDEIRADLKEEDVELNPTMLLSLSAMKSVMKECDNEEARLKSFVSTLSLCFFVLKNRYGGKKMVEVMKALSNDISPPEPDDVDRYFAEQNEE